MKTRFRNTFLLTFTALFLISCGSDDAGQIDTSDLDKNTPDGAFLLTMNTLAESDIQAAVKNSLSQDKYNELVTEFEAKKNEPMDAEQKAQFNEGLALINQDDAEQQLFAMIAPQLTQVRAFMPMMLMGAKDQISQQLGADKTSLAPRCNSNSEVVDATVTWIMDNDILQEDKVKNSIAELVAMGRDLDLSSADDLQNLNFDEALEMGGQVFSGFKNALNAHGIDVNAILSSAQVSDVTINGEQATMIASYEVFGKTACSPVTMIKRDGIWVVNPQ
ncbi:hypothetical protein [Marinicella gelatinilytica]|uniref:hypothetical protein n=1 Tax=Marinicella gelatinilytica TaxID=2996017 RepID=UPI0022608CA4|nr:hypothetical protein [Marinicella gelatinilytica]MCX7545302.1 hypothetical protein [Marinicella gelatinilytica]